MTQSVALSACSETRGRAARGGGEFELKRLLELTGMTEHVSFDTQEAGYGVTASGRPDVVLRIPGNPTVPIDAKVPFARDQEAVSAQSEAEREPLLDQAVAAKRERSYRVGIFAEKFGKTGSALNSAIEEWNEAAASFDGRLAPQTRKIVALRGDSEKVPQPVDQLARARSVDVTRLPSVSHAVERESVSTADHVIIMEIETSLA